MAKIKFKDFDEKPGWGATPVDDEKPGWGATPFVESKTALTSTPIPGNAPNKNFTVTGQTIFAPAESPIGVERLPLSPKPPAGPSVKGLLGSAARGLAPTAAGALAGLPFGGLPGAAVGAGLVNLVDPAVSLYNALTGAVNKTTGTNIPPGKTVKDVTDWALNKAGVPEDQTAWGRTAEAIAGGVGGAKGSVEAAKWISQYLNNPNAKNVALEMAKNPTQQMVAGGTGGAGSQFVAEAGGGPVGQLVGGLVGGALPYATVNPAKIAANLSKPIEPAPGVMKMHQAGYVLPPAEMTQLGENPPKAISIIAGEAGKIKAQQAFSEKNQIKTNEIAAKSIGLDGKTLLNEEALKKAQQPAIKAYEEIKAAVPEVTFGPEWKDQAQQLGRRQGLLEKYFPGSENTPEIQELRQQLLKYGAGDTVPTQVVMDKIAQWRKDANTMFKSAAREGDVSKSRTAAAMKDAANILEEQLERSVENAPNFYTKKINDSIKSATDNRNQIEIETRNLEKANKTLDYVPKNDVEKAMLAYDKKLAAKEKDRATKIIEKLNTNYENINKEIDHWRNNLEKSQTKDGSSIVEKFREARQLFAKIFNVEDVTNTATGNVSARKMNALKNKGVPLSEGLDTIADAYGVAPKSMQDPSTFGRTPEYSAFDVMLGLTTAASGHAGVAGLSVLRPTFAKQLMSPEVQAALLGERRNGMPPEFAPNLLQSKMHTTGKAPPLSDPQKQELKEGYASTWDNEHYWTLYKGRPAQITKQGTLIE